MRKNFLFTITLFFLLTGISKSLAQSWQNVGPASLISNGTSNFQGIVMDNLGTPYICYQDAVDSNKTVVKKYDGNNWNNVGLPAFGGTEKLGQELDIDSSGNLYLAHSDILDSNKVYVMKYDGSSWTQLGTGPVCSVVSTSQKKLIVIQGTPYIAYRDSDQGNKATVKKFDGANWVAVGTLGFTSTPVYVFDFKTNGTEPYLLTASDPTVNLTLLKFDGTNWINVGNPALNVGGGTLLITGNTPYIAYDDPGATSKTSVKKYDGTNWVQVGQTGFSNGIASHRDFINNNGELTLVYQNSGVHVKKFNGTNFWLTHSTINNGYYGKLASFNGTLYFAYSSHFDGKKCKVIKYCAAATRDTTAFNECAGFSVTIGSNTYSSTGVYSDTLSNFYTCDSIIITDLNIGTPIDVSTSTTGFTITAAANGATYQWLDCNNNNNVISGETNQSFSPTSNGDYSVIVTVGNCSDTSSCVNIAGLSLNQINSQVKFNISPNPTYDILKVTSSESIEQISIHLLDGKTIKVSTEQSIQVSKLPQGTYIIQVITNKGVGNKLFMKL